MPRLVRLLVILSATAGPAGCGDPKPPPTPAHDPETIRQLEELQKRGSQGEKGR